MTTSPELFNLTGEQDLLGFVMTNPEDKYLTHRLQAEHFYEPRHRKIWQTIETLTNNGKLADANAVTNELRQTQQLDELGGRQYIFDMVSRTEATRSNLEDTAEDIIKHSTKRRLRDLSFHIDSKLQDGLTAEQILEYCQSSVIKIGQAAINDKPISYHDCLAAEFERMLVRHQTEELPGITSGFQQIDDITNGAKPGELIILAGRPGMGKSAFGFHLARQSGLSGVPSAMFSGEMTEEQFAKRAMSSACNIPHQRIERGPLSPEEEKKIRDYIDGSVGLPFDLCMTAGYGIGQIVALAQRMRVEMGLKFLVIDYLQLMANGGKQFENLNIEIQYITRTLKQLALRLEMPIILLSQLNRGVESRQDKRPMLSDLRDSGAVEQDADIVLMLYRDEYYNPSTTKRGEIEINVAKNRSGRTDTISLLFQASTITFSDRISGGLII